MSVGEARRIEDGERAPNSNEYEAIWEFFGWPDARCYSRRRAEEVTATAAECLRRIQGPLAHLGG